MACQGVRGDPGPPPSATGVLASPLASVVSSDLPSSLGAFEEQAYAELAHGHWEELLDAELEREVWMEAQPELFDPLSLQEYRFWFDGAGPYPDGTGYAVGLGFVRSYLERHRGMDPADLAFVDYGEVIEESGYAP